MSIEDIWNEENEDKTIPEEAPKASKKSEVDGDSTTKGVDESKEAVVEEAPAPSKAEDVDDWFAPAVDEPVKEEPAEDKPTDGQSVEEESVKERADEKSPDEEAEAAETPATEAATEVEDDWFVPAEEQATVETPSAVSAGAGVPMSIEASPIVCQAVSAEVMKEQMRRFQKLKASLLDKSDIATIKNKPFIKRSGWRKMGLAFNLSDDIVKEERDDFEGGFRWRMWVMVSAPNGRRVIGVASCSSDERDFAHLEHDVYSICHTRAKNRALSDMIGSGEVSWEELRGMA